MKPTIWMGRSRRDLKEFPEEVRRVIGHALSEVQSGERPEIAEVLKGFGNAKVWAIHKNDPSGTYRAVYTIEFSEYVFILHVFHKKSKSGIETPKPDLDLIKERLKDAKIRYKQLTEDAAQ